jgi:hypothetical protein
VKLSRSALPRLVLALSSVSPALLASLLASGGAGCGGSEKPVAAPAPAEDTVGRRRVPPDDDEESDDGVEIEGLRGHLERSDIEAGVSPHHEELSACFTSRVGKRRFLGGQVELKWLVARDGAVKQVVVTTSDLGAWEVEKCLLEVGRSMHFARPKGGEAEFSLPLDFPARGAVLPWDGDKATMEVEKHLPDLAQCTDTGAGAAAAPGEVVVTLYVGTRGQVQSAGFAAEGPVDDTWADCAATLMQGWTLSDPRGKVAKLAFRYTP